MILKPLPFAEFTALLDSDHPIALCRVAPDQFKTLVLNLHDAGYGAVVMDVAMDERKERCVLVRCRRKHYPKLLNDLGRWSRKIGVEFVLAPALTATEPSRIVFPAGRTVAVLRVYEVGNLFTGWWAHRQTTLPQGWLRL